MYDVSLPKRGDMCMTLPCPISTLPRLIILGRGFDASFLRLALAKKLRHICCFKTASIICSVHV